MYISTIESVNFARTGHTIVPCLPYWCVCVGRQTGTRWRPVVRPPPAATRARQGPGQAGGWPPPDSTEAPEHQRAGARVRFPAGAKGDGGGTSRRRAKGG